ncbi:MAG: hypothetical protein Q8N63_03340 [Nanoarchaeota archaeon]|nr:hypothetical protein [Nanoarchaeota archaeon]
MKLKELLQTFFIITGTLAGVVGCEKFGVTEAFVKYWDMQHKLYSALADKGLCLYSYDKNESEIEREIRLKKYQVVADVGLGFQSSIYSGVISLSALACLERRKNKREKRKL